MVLSMITLDGIMQGPGGPQEDPSDGFEFGDWIIPYGDEIYRAALQDELQPAEYLLGRKTFDLAIQNGCEMISKPANMEGDSDTRGSFYDCAGNYWSVSTQTK